MTSLAARQSRTQTLPCTIATLPSPAQPGDGAEATQFRQLRHHTKNALQRLLGLVAEAPELRDIQGGRALSEALQHRIMLAARVSDALFGFARHPGALKQRLIALSLGVVELLGDDQAEIDVDVSVESPCPASLHDVLLRVANEFVGNAVKHGMHARLLGRIEVRVRPSAGRVALTVTDDGWGWGRAELRAGEGLSLALILAREHGGAVSLRRQGQRTVATFELPSNDWSMPGSKCTQEDRVRAADDGPRFFGKHNS